jgi:arylsulfatase A
VTATRPNRPNIVLIVADDLGYGDLGAFGNPHVQTPHLDRLAAEGLRLTQHYSGSAVCAPARAALMTGRYPHRTGAIDTLEGRGLDRLALREVTLADRLALAGYATGLVGKWHLGALDPRYHPNRRGFQEFCGFRGGWIDYYDYRLDRNGSFSVSDGRYVTDVFADEAVAFVERRAARPDPFFLHVTFNAPHFPLECPEADVAPFKETGRFTSAVSTIYGMNRRMDAGVGRILEALDGHGARDNTLVLFTSDNGPQFGRSGDESTTRFNGHFNGSKGTVFEGGIRVPAILRWPDGLPGGGATSAYPVHFTDWLPTLLAIAGIDAAHGPAAGPLDGRNALAALRGEAGVGDAPPRFWQWNRYTPVVECNAAVRDGDWKLVRPRIPEAMQVAPDDLAVDRALKQVPCPITDVTRTPEPERHLSAPPPPLLFNVAGDPYEQHDLASEHPERVRHLEAALAAWFESVERDRRSIADETTDAQRE